MLNGEITGGIGGLIIGFLLTVFIYSFIIKDNPMYRLAVHIAVGISAGFAAVVVVREVMVPVAESIVSGEDATTILLWIVPLLLGAMLLLKLLPGLAWLGNSSMAVLIAVGSAVGLVGAIMGTLIPQITVEYSEIWITLLVAVLTICVLAYFHFTARFSGERQIALPDWFRHFRLLGKIVMTIALAGVFAGFFGTTLVLLSERVGFYFNSFKEIIAG